jgi:glucosamine-phosphate N-acetyltransferase
MNNNFRILKKADYLEYIRLMNQFRPLNVEVSEQKYIDLYNKIFKNNIIFVIEYNNKLIATAKLIIDEKFFHNYAKYGFIEDVIVDNNFRGKHIGIDLIKHIIDYCKINNFFKVTLTCKEYLIPFYEKNGFEVYDKHMSILL